MLRLQVMPLWIAGALGIAPGAAWPQTIYTCVDKNGRHLSADRPIPECMDREQRQLSRLGVVTRVIAPNASPAEAARAAAARRVADQERQQRALALQQDRALLLRYPQREAHDRARAGALAQMDAVIAELGRRETEWMAHPARSRTGDELSHLQQLLKQQRAERERVNTRFDEELKRLDQLWTAPAGG